MLRGERWAYFTSSKSHVLELCAWLGRTGRDDPMAGASRTGRRNAINHTAAYTDTMLWRAGG